MLAPCNEPGADTLHSCLTQALNIYLLILGEGLNSIQLFVYCAWRPGPPRKGIYWVLVSHGTLHFQTALHQYVPNSPGRTESHRRTSLVGLTRILTTQGGCLCLQHTLVLSSKAVPQIQGTALRGQDTGAHLPGVREGALPSHLPGRLKSICALPRRK